MRYRTLVTLVALNAFGPLAPALAQEGVGMKRLLETIGILPDESAEPPSFRERPSIVLPKDLSKLPKPEDPQARANPQWPVDPDVAAREKAKKDREFSLFIPTGQTPRDPRDGGKLSLEELKAGRIKRGADTSNQKYNYGDGDGRLSVHEMNQQASIGLEPSSPPGTEPPRRYLTDPPVGSRIPSQKAVIGRKTAEKPFDDSEFNRPDRVKLD